jgi:thiol:disulfide interchange protein DsbD
MNLLPNKLIIAFTLFCLISISAWSQDSTGAIQDWKISAKKIGEHKYELVFNGNISGNWQVYAPDQSLLDAKTTELKFSDSGIVQDSHFILESAPKKIKSALFDNTEVKIFEKAVHWKVIITFAATVPARLPGTLFYTYGRNDEFYPSTRVAFIIPLEGGVESTARIKIPTIDINNPLSPCGDEGTKGKGILKIFLLGFLGGLIALLTPCVFPMVPVTVTFFTKKSQSRRKGITNGILYGFFIFLIYVLITIPFHIASKTISPEIFNNISTNVVLNLIFFAIFVAFALSFFGLYEIGLPSGLANKADSKSGLGNMAGIFFMAGTLAIVSFSCTGPILGTLLTNVAGGGAWPLTAGAAGFGIALGLPFALFAMFPNWLHSLPKSGGWMTDVKVVLGFIELALAVKFLSNADLVKQWGLLKREMFIGLWVIIGICIVLYLSGILKIGHASPVRKFSKIRIAFIAMFAAFTIYLIPGITNTRWAKLAFISGFPPPHCYSIYSNPVNCDKPLFDYEQAIQLARQKNKPVLIDFTGWACVNCRRMEEKVWTNPAVEKMMKNDFILVSLYVDERRKLPPDQQTTYTTKTGNVKSIVTVGDKWATFQTENFDATSQPQYAMVSPDEILLAKTKFYTKDPAEFANWLRCGLEAFRKKEK